MMLVEQDISAWDLADLLYDIEEQDRLVDKMIENREWEEEYLDAVAELEDEENGNQ